ncbi:MAG: response regulator [Microscillaceae bacterium]|nr:response regulator [Microscillaceae bacterium]
MRAEAPNSLRKIWIVDDNDIDALICNRIMERSDPHTQISHYAEGEEALLDLQKKIKENPQELPDLILLDLYMPIVNGWKFVSRYREMGHLLPQKIILLLHSCTGLDSDIRQACDQAEIDGFVNKPFTPEKYSHIRQKYFR